MEHFRGKTYKKILNFFGIFFQFGEGACFIGNIQEVASDFEFLASLLFTRSSVWRKNVFILESQNLASHSSKVSWLTFLITVKNVLKSLENEILFSLPFHDICNQTVSGANAFIMFRMISFSSVNWTSFSFVSCVIGKK